jgi:hypothetical protein
MRGSVLAAAAVCIGLVVGGAASARVWTHPNGRVTFDAPSGWTTSPPREIQTSSYVITGSANNECHVLVLANTNTATATVAQIQRAAADATRFPADVWTRTLNGVSGVFPGNSANVLSQSVETNGFWPIQRAEVQGPERLVHAAIQIRPGVDIVILCMTYDGADSAEMYDAFIRSVGHPRDAEWQASAAAPAPQ